MVVENTISVPLGEAVVAGIVAGEVQTVARALEGLWAELAMLTLLESERHGFGELSVVTVGAR